MRDKLSGRSPEDKQMGPNPVLTKAEESSLASFCIKLLKCSFPINREDLFDIVQNVVKQEGRKTPFTDGRPGFKKAGLYPFDASAVDYTKCVKDQLRKTLSATVAPSPPVLSSDEVSILSNHLNFIEEHIGDEKLISFSSAYSGE